jgi:hypothetical protein
MNRLAVVLLLACSLTAGSAQERALSPEAALADAEARWRARQPKAYEFAVDVRCFCPGLVRTPPGFAVTDGVPRSLHELELFSQRVYDHYTAIEKLFATIRGSLSRGRSKMVVQYHADLGYPLVAELDPNADVMDDELFLRLTDLKPTGGAANASEGGPGAPIVTQNSLAPPRARREEGASARIRIPRS